MSKNKSVPQIKKMEIELEVWEAPMEEKGVP